MKILITGALGQIGSELSLALKQIYGSNNVINSDLPLPQNVAPEYFPYVSLDVTNKQQLVEVITKNKIEVVYHLAAILSASGEKNPQLCFDVNILGLYYVLEASRQNGIKQIICPSSIAVFGPETPKQNTPQETIILPKTMYGLSKASGELLCDYYVAKYNLDIRGLRYPGLISYKTPPGGGTTDYAVEIFYAAIQNGNYQCFLQENTILPMMYMPDAIRGTIELACANFSKLKNHSNFNFAGISFSCGELACEIQKHLKHFTINYQPDFRQQIANSWPQSIDDSQAKEQWGWQCQYDLAKITTDMLRNLQIKLNKL